MNVLFSDSNFYVGFVYLAIRGGKGHLVPV